RTTIRPSAPMNLCPMKTSPPDKTRHPGRASRPRPQRPRPRCRHGHPDLLQRHSCARASRCGPGDGPSAHARNPAPACGRLSEDPAIVGECQAPSRAVGACGSISRLNLNLALLFQPRRQENTMNSTTPNVLTPDQQAMLATWQQHTYAEFVLKDADAALATMTENPYLLMIATGTACIGRAAVRDYYASHFLHA